MFDERKPIRGSLDNANAGITIRLNQEEREPFEVTVFLKKIGSAADETAAGDAVSLKASGRLRLTIGKRGFIEIFAENGGELRNGGSAKEVEERGAFSAYSIINENRPNASIVSISITRRGNCGKGLPILRTGSTGSSRNVTRLRRRSIASSE
jgi:hypothetical protein